MPSQHAARASLAPRIYADNPADHYALWMELTGQAEPESLDDVYHVQHGKHLEPFVLDWVQNKMLHLPIIERQREVTHPTLGVHRATLDGYIAEWDAVVECKVLNAFARYETAGFETGFYNYYSPQVAMQMACRPAKRGVLCVQQGNGAPNLYDVNVEQSYIDKVLERMAWFQLCVETLKPPGKPPPAPVPPERWTTIDLAASELPNWAHVMKPLLDTWQATKPQWSEHEQAKKDIKHILPDHVGRVTHGAITIKRARNNAVSIVEAA